MTEEKSKDFGDYEDWVKSELMIENMDALETCSNHVFVVTNKHSDIYRCTRCKGFLSTTAVFWYEAGIRDARPRERSAKK